MASLPVWFLKHDTGEGSAVLVWVHKFGGTEAKPYLLTAQHVARAFDGTQKTYGPYADGIKVWAPQLGYNPLAGIATTVDRVLSPPDDTPLAGPTDLAFLALDPNHAAGSAAPVLPIDQCKAGLGGLTISGYSGGSAQIGVHGNIVDATGFTLWTFNDFVEPSARGLLLGTGNPKSGTSGGGVFHNGKYAGLYRGEFEKLGEHLFIPLISIQQYLSRKGHELVSPAPQTGGNSGQSDGLSPLHLQEAAALKVELEQFRVCKSLHDHLHLIQKGYVNAAKAARAPAFESMVVDNFTDASQAMEEETAKLERTIKGIPKEFGDLTTDAAAWFPKLQVCVATAVKAALEIDGPAAQKACRDLARLLRQHLPRINESLVNKARAMATNRVSLLFAGLDAIKSRMIVHDQWQNIDLILWDAEQMVFSKDAMGFSAQWDDIVSSVQPILAAEPKAPWAAKLANSITTISPVLQAPDPWATLPPRFDSFARDARSRFFWVDLDLKDQAEEAVKLAPMLA
ncbi:hypothetical protein AYO49_04660 [Verrucomicrobiaceae bacterium SCGC AG-212-N21]|nr:hypothetical protein AYO49_04660 [Verrucomicrobiaceae bacterium SCGC AG-212-N21]